MILESPDQAKHITLTIGNLLNSRLCHPSHAQSFRNKSLNRSLHWDLEAKHWNSDMHLEGQSVLKMPNIPTLGGHGSLLGHLLRATWTLRLLSDFRTKVWNLEFPKLAIWNSVDSKIMARKPLTRSWVGYFLWTAIYKLGHVDWQTWLGSETQQKHNLYAFPQSPLLEGCSVTIWDLGLNEACCESLVLQIARPDSKCEMWLDSWGSCSFGLANLWITSDFHVAIGRT